MDKKGKFTYIGRLFINKDKDNKTYLKGKLKHGSFDVEVVGFLNEIEIKTGDKAGTTVKAFSIALSTKEPVKVIKDDPMDAF